MIKGAFDLKIICYDFIYRNCRTYIDEKICLNGNIDYNWVIAEPDYWDAIPKLIVKNAETNIDYKCLINLSYLKKNGDYEQFYCDLLTISMRLGKTKYIDVCWQKIKQGYEIGPILSYSYDIKIFEYFIDKYIDYHDLTNIFFEIIWEQVYAYDTNKKLINDIFCKYKNRINKINLKKLLLSDNNNFAKYINKYC